MQWSYRVFLFGLISFLACPIVVAHEGPDPICQWFASKMRLTEGRLKSVMGPDAEINGNPQLEEDAWGAALRFDGADDYLAVDGGMKEIAERFQPTAFTVSVWASVDRPRANGGLVHCMQKAADGEKGWMLGYNGESFRFALAALGADDGNGRATEIISRTKIEPGRVYHLAASYDGHEMCLYVNGELEARSTQQSGPVIFAGGAKFTIAACRDMDELQCHQGTIRDVALFDMVATEAWARGEFDHGKELAAKLPNSLPSDGQLTWVVPPYLQFVTQTGITVMCETSVPTHCTVRYGEDDKLPHKVESEGVRTLHELRLEGLAPQTGHYYTVEVKTEEGGSVTSPLYSFQTANLQDTPLMFGVIGDTQYNPKVSKILTDMMWAQRPNFFIIAGDLTDVGPNKSHWTEHFFPGVTPIASRVAFFPVLGNHERDAKHYYDYMALPPPEYYYTFHYGNTQFFMLDSNKELGPGSEQYVWLEKELAASRAVWKFACYHHPGYSSDEDDYGNSWRGKSVYGELRLRPLNVLYDKYGMDIVWNGHIHSYERSWPLHNDKPVEEDGVIHIVTGGGGGGLETAGPIKPYFQNNVKHGHHYCLVSINGGKLEFKAFDMEGRLFDTMQLDKSKK